MQGCAQWCRGCWLDAAAPHNLGSTLPCPILSRPATLHPRPPPLLTSKNSPDLTPPPQVKGEALAFYARPGRDLGAWEWQQLDNAAYALLAEHFNEVTRGGWSGGWAVAVAGPGSATSWSVHWLGDCLNA